MVIKGIIKKGEYFDSVSLMIVAKNLRELDYIIDSSVVMATQENQAILKTANLFIKEFQNTRDNDLLIVIKAKNEDQADEAILKADEFLLSLKSNDAQSDNFRPKSSDGAKKILPEANLVLISVAGKFAFNEAMTALKDNMNVMIFSDNVSIEEELELKNYAEKNNLLVMGPDCGTSIINGVPLAFANSVNKGNIGIVGASGTGIQEVSSLIDNFGYGISHAIGTGGRDIKEKIGGISFLKALTMLNEDDATKVILMVSNPRTKLFWIKFLNYYRILINQ